MIALGLAVGLPIVLLQLYKINVGPVDDDEKMAEALDLFEHLEIHRLVAQRARKKQKKTVSLGALLKKQESLKRLQARHL